MVEHSTALPLDETRELCLGHECVKEEEEDEDDSTKRERERERETNVRPFVCPSVRPSDGP